MATREKAGTSALGPNFGVRTLLNAAIPGLGLASAAFGGQNQQRVDGKIEVEITERGTRIKRLESANPGVELAARTGLVVDSPL